MAVWSRPMTPNNRVTAEVVVKLYGKGEDVMASGVANVCATGARQQIP